MAETRRPFSDEEIRKFLDHLERIKFLTQKPELDIDDLDNGLDEEPLAGKSRVGCKRVTAAVLQDSPTSDGVPTFTQVCRKDAHRLSELSQELRKMVTQFKTD